MTLLVVLVAVAVTISLVQRYDAQPETSGLAVLLDQLNDVDAQQKAGAVSDDTADQLRLEIKRRILTEGHAPKSKLSPFSGRTRIGIAFATAGIIAVGATTIYALRGAPDQGAAGPAGQAVAQPGLPAGEHPAGDAEAMVRSLEQRLAAEPNDAEGWRMLGWSYFQLRRFADSAQAYGRARKIAPNEPGYASAMGESLVQAADGVVTPEARSAFEAARKMDSSDARARYFLAVLKDQQGNAKGAIEDWIALLNDSPADAPWVPHLRNTVTESAAKAGIDVSARLPAVAPVAPVAPGPSQADMDAAAQLSPDERQAMIKSMVDGLAAKLATNPNDADGWMRLMRAQMVLGDTSGARAAYRTALRTFATDAAAIGQLTKAAQDLGLPDAVAK